MRISKSHFVPVVPVALAMVLLLASCNWGAPFLGATYGNTVVTRTDLSSRLAYSTDASRLTVSDSALSTPQLSRGARAVAVAPDAFTLVATVAPPSFAGATLGATDVVVSGNYAYVTYNLRGDGFSGAVDVIDISNSSRPALIQSVTFGDTDFNSAYVSSLPNGKPEYLYLVGGMGANALSSVLGVSAASLAANTATIERFQLKNTDGTLQNPESSGNKFTALPGYQATSVFRTASPATMSALYVTAGDAPTAGMFEINANTFKVDRQELFDSAKFLDAQNDSATPLIAVLEGYQNLSHTAGRGHLRLYKSGNSGYFREIPIGNVNTYDTKNSVELYGGIAYLALGESGMKAYDTASASDTSRYSISSGFSAAANTVANAVAADAKYVYVAAGEGGLWAAPKASADAGGELDVYGIVKFPASGGGYLSANSVYTDPSKKLVFVAGGTGGLKIVRY